MSNIELYIRGIRKDKQHPLREPDYIDKIVICFLEIFPDYDVVNRGIERSAAGKLARIYKQKYPQATSQEALDAFSLYFKACKHIDDTWLMNNMSLPLIMSKFSIINRIIRMKKQKKVTVFDKYLNGERQHLPELRK